MEQCLRLRVRALYFVEFVALSEAVGVEQYMRVGLDNMRARVAVYTSALASGIISLKTLLFAIHAAVSAVCIRPLICLVASGVAQDWAQSRCVVEWTPSWVLTCRQIWWTRRGKRACKAVWGMSPYVRWTGG